MIQPQLACPYCGSRDLETARWYKDEREIYDRMHELGIELNDYE